MNQSVISSKVRKEEKMNGVAQVFCPWQTLRRFGCFPEWESLKGWRKRVRPRCSKGGKDEKPGRVGDDGQGARDETRRPGSRSTGVLLKIAAVDGGTAQSAVSSK